MLGLGFIISMIFNILANVLSIVSVVFFAYSLFTVARGWNKTDNQDLFNLTVISGGFLILVRIIDLIIRKATSYGFFFRPVLSLLLVFLAILVPVLIYVLAKSAGDVIYEDGYFNKLSDTEFLKAEIAAAFGLFMGAIGNIGSKVSENAEAKREKNAYKANNQANMDNDSYKYTQDAGEFQGMLKENRSLLLYILLNIVTCGFYSLYFIHTVARDVNIACAGDGDHTAGLLKHFILSILTCGIYSIYWDYALANRTAANGQRYGYHIQENGTNFLLWMLLGWWLCGLGYFVARNITIKNVNTVCRGYNNQNRIY